MKIAATVKIKGNDIFQSKLRNDEKIHTSLFRGKKIV